MIEPALRLACSLFILTCLCFFGWAIALRLGPLGTLARWTSAFVLSSGGATVTFLALAFIGRVSSPTLVGVATCLAGLGARVAGRERIVAAMRDDGRALRFLPSRIGWPAVAVIVVVLLAYSVLASAAVVSPLLGWDSLHYHLLHVAYWAQDAGFASRPGVDAWGYYEFFPIGGEILWAWVAIPSRSNVLVGPGGVMLCAAAALATASAARSLGATPKRAALAAAALVVTPAITALSTNGYVDNTTFAFVASGTALLLEAARPEGSPFTRLPLVALAGAACGMAVGVKTTALTFLVLGAVAATVTLRARCEPLARCLRGLVVFSVASSLFVPRMAYTWWRTGSPLYPFPLRVFGRVVSNGNEQLRSIIEGPFAVREPPFTDLVRRLFFGSNEPGWAHVNFGVTGLVLFVLGIAGLAYWIWTRPRDLRALFFVGLALPAGMYFFGSTTSAYRLEWWWVIARFMLPGLLGAVLLASVLPKPWIDEVLGVTALLGAPLPLMNGMCGYRLVGAASLLVPAVATMAVVVIAWRRSRVGGAVLVSLGCAGIIALTGPLRRELAPLVLRGAMRDECVDGFPLMGGRAAPYPIWERLADMPPKRIAVVAGFDGLGLAVFRYPLLGSKWQHHVSYLSPSADGVLRNYGELYVGGKPTVELSYERWYQRVREERVDYVVFLFPYNVVEYRWVKAHPETFQLEETGLRGTSLLFRVQPS